MTAWYRRRWVLGLGGALLLVCLTVLLLLATPLGLKLGLRFAPPELEIAEVEGSVIGGFDLAGVVYRAPTAEIEIDAVRFDWSPLALFGASAHVEAIGIGRVLVRIKPALDAPAEAPEADAEPFVMPDLRLPIDVQLDRLSVAAISIEEEVEGETVIHMDLDGVDLADLTFVDALLTLGSFTMVNANGRIDIDGQALLAEPFAADVTLAANLADELLIDARVNGDVDVLNFDVDTTGLVVTDLDVDLTALLDQPAFALTLNLRIDDLARFFPDAPIDALSLSFDAGGSAESVAATSRVSVPGITDLEITQDIDLDLARGQIDINRFEVAEVDLPGRLVLDGEISIDPDRPSRLSLVWADLSRIELAAVGLHTEAGRVDLNGTVEDFELDLDFGFASDFGAGRVDGRITGEPEVVHVERLTLAALGGEINVAANARYGDDLAADGTLSVRAIDLAPIVGQPTVVGLDAAFDVAQPAGAEFIGEVDLSDITGTVAGRELDGRGRVAVRGETLDLQDFLVLLGDNRIALSGFLGDRLELDADIDAEDLSQVLPELAGSLTGEVRATGTLEQPRATVQLDGAGLEFADIALAILDVDAEIDLAGGPLAVQAALTGIESGEQRIDSVSLTVAGTQAAHDGRLDVAAELADLAVGWNGGLLDETYAGTLSALAIDLQDFEGFGLAEPVPFRASAEAQALESPLCLAAVGSELCLSGSRDAAVMAAEVTLSEVTLDQFQGFVDKYAPEPAVLAGSVSGSASFEAAADGSEWSATADIDSPSITLTVRRNAADVVFGQEGLRLDAQISPEQVDIDLAATLIPQATLEARVSSDRPDPTAPLSGSFLFDVPDFAVFKPLVPQLGGLSGRARIEADVSGTGEAPQVTVRSSIEELEAFLTALGLQLSDGYASLTVDDSGRGEVEAAISSGDGQVEVTSEFAAGDGQARLEVRGENFVGMNTEEIEALVSPDLAIDISPELLTVRGSVEIPRLLVDLTALEGSVAGSPDVVVVGRDDETASAPLDLDVQVVLGDEIQLFGFGVDGRLSGQVRVRQRPGQAMLCTGQVNIAGGLNAYGQDLQVQRGRLLFAGVPCDNPTLDIVAEREIDDDVTAGVRVSGAGSFPVLTVFSNPARDESEALCMLVTGGSCSSDDSGAVEDAILAAGLSASSAVTNRIGQQAGLDDLSLTSSDEFEGAGFTMGKQIAPRIWVSYGRSFSNNVQYFEVAYEITRRFEVSIRQALETITSVRYHVELD